MTISTEERQKKTSDAELESPEEEKHRINTADKAAVLHRCPTFPTLIICSFICCSTHSFTVKSTVRAVFTSLKAELL